MLPGCRNDQVTAPVLKLSTSVATVSDSVANLPAIQPGDSAAAGTLARAFALALADVGFRKQILEDMRDSPFPNHAIHVSSYLAGNRGRALAFSAAQRAGIAPDQLIAHAAVRGGLQLVMRRPMDRASWTGSADIVVMGVAATVKERLGTRPLSIGYDIQGRAIPIPILAAVPFPFIVIEPKAKSFGPDPEGRRQNAPARGRSTISTKEEEWVASYAGPTATTTGGPCDPLTMVIECGAEDPHGTGPFPGTTLPSSYTFSTCYPSSGVGDPALDADTDGVVDQCEYELATAFRPQMQFDSRDCDTRREPYWAARHIVSPIDNVPVIRIFYALSYYFDCGSPSSFCPTQCESHPGDSEFIIAEVVSYGDRWILKRATLSAHFNSDAGTPMDTYAGEDLEYGGARQQTNAVIWVALGKHANYRSKAVCDAGMFYYDTCDSPGVRPYLEVLPDANLGRDQDQIIDEVGSRIFRPGVERYWGPNDYYFLGWWDRSEASASNTTAYGKLLRYFDFQ